MGAIITGSAKHRYLILPGSNFDVFRLAQKTSCRKGRLIHAIFHPLHGHPGWHYNVTSGDVTWRSLNANVRYIIRCFCLRFVCCRRLVGKLSETRHCRHLVGKSCWSYDKTYDTQSFVGHGNRTALGWTCHTRAAPLCDVQPLVVIFPCSTHYHPSSVNCRFWHLTGCQSNLTADIEQQIKCNIS